MGLIYWIFLCNLFCCYHFIY